MESPRKKRIFFFVPSAFGHLNPVCGLAYELSTRHNVECIVYGVDEHRGLIEKSGARFRSYAHRNIADVSIPLLTDKQQTEAFQNQVFTWIHEWSYALLPQFVNDVETDKPDLIIFDFSFISVKFLLEIFKQKGTPLRAIEFYPNFVINKRLMKEENLFKLDLKKMLHIIPMVFRQFSFNRTFNISVYNPIGFLLNESDNLKIVAVFPELHPHLNEYNDKYKFVGQCASEEARNFSLNDDKQLKELFDLFPPKQENTSNSQTDGLKFIVMSLGTGFHVNWFIFDILFQALKEFDLKPNRRLKMSQLRLLVSVGEPGLKHFSDRIAKGELELPSNVLLRPKIPQLEALKRADLFVTHCGMNSTSEAIKYAVPIVAIPITADQPLVAKRTCDELKLGVRLGDALKLKADELADAIDNVLSDETYRDNMKAMSRTSAKYNGAVDGAKLVIDYLNS